MSRLGPELARLAPREVVVSENNEPLIRPIVTDFGAALTPLARASFDSNGAEQRLCALYGVATLEGFGTFDRADLAALGGLVEYLDLTQRGRLPLLRPPVREVAERVMQIDAATRRNLELTQGMTGGREGSLLAAIDRTLTAGGGRLLERRLSSPSRDLLELRARHAAVGWLLESRALAETLRAALREVPDIDRALSRLALERGGPRDLGAIRAGLAQAAAISRVMPADLPDQLREAVNSLTGDTALTDLLDTCLVAEPPLLARDGGFVSTGHNTDLDEARGLRDEGRGMIAAMQADYAATAGVSSLKIRHNNVLGYFIETTATHAEKMMKPPLNETFIHRQTTANQIRFTALALSEMETKILNAGGRALEIEKRIFEELRQAVIVQAGPIAQVARGLAEIDLACAFADLASAEDWCAPRVDDSRAFAITGGRHPVVERALRRDGASFVANDCDLSGTGDTAAIWLLTGPNMAGKSTFLRQNALIAILAQAGAFVPASFAHIGLVSQVFSRVGASDDLARGRSTFMVEMVETAAILNQADGRALVILDEIGRGTATWDGLSIAWAVLEHLHDVNRARALFATHYHEMTTLAGRLEGVANATVAVREWDGEVIFLHEVQRGAADRSYGVQVARLAGLPDSVVARARVVLDALEKGQREGGARSVAVLDDLPLFAARAPQAVPTLLAPVLSRLAVVRPDELSPREALDLIYELRRMLDD
jgi:DNA mismatch repair protein MutS